MTQLGLDYLRHQEQRRSNLANERETNRANLAKESENLRHNTATETQAVNELAETNRSNLAKERENYRHNTATESLDYLRHQEQRRSNLANEKETNRANVARESENYRHNTATEVQAAKELAETNRSNIAREGETNRHNVRAETLEDIKNQAMKEHYERQDANQIEVANIQADSNISREKLANKTKERINENDNQTRRMVELTKLMPKSVQYAVASAYAAEDPVFKKNLDKFEAAKGAAKEVAKEALINSALTFVKLQLLRLPGAKKVKHPGAGRSF